MMKKLKALLTVVICFTGLLLFAQVATTPASAVVDKSLLSTFLDGLRWGTISVLQPCLYAMFPVTVSFFFKAQPNEGPGN